MGRRNLLLLLVVVGWALAAVAAPKGKGRRMAKRQPRLVSLEGQALTDSAFAAKISSGLLAADVGRLQLDGNQLTALSIQALAKSPLTTVRTLSLAGNRMGDEGAAAIAGAALFRGVRELTLYENGLSARGIEALVGDASSLADLWGLMLSGNPIGDAGVRAIAASPRVGRLQSLVLEKVGMTDEGAAALAESPNLGQLLTLYVGGNALTERGKDALRGSRKLRSCQVVFD